MKLIIERKTLIRKRNFEELESSVNEMIMNVTIVQYIKIGYKVVGRIFSRGGQKCKKGHFSLKFRNYTRFFLKNIKV